MKDFIIIALAATLAWQNLHIEMAYILFLMVAIVTTLVVKEARRLKRRGDKD